MDSGHDYQHHIYTQSSADNYLFKLDVSHIGRRSPLTIVDTNSDHPLKCTHSTPRLCKFSDLYNCKMHIIITPIKKKQKQSSVVHFPQLTKADIFNGFHLLVQLNIIIITTQRMQCEFHMETRLVVLY